VKPLIFILPIIFLCNTAYAVELKKEIAKCATVEGELARLNCYDKLADTIGVSKKKLTNQKKTGKWVIDVEKNPIDDSKTIVAILDAKSGISNFGRPVSLLLRCQSKTTDAFINWGSYLGDDSPEVLIRIGDAEATTERWNSSTDKTATFYPGDAIEFVKKLEINKKFVAQITPYMESPITAVFDLNGIEKVTKTLKETCVWDKPEEELPKEKQESNNDDQKTQH
jgi:Type VI secretion system VasI, EvfG, VC_A0118